MDLIRNFQNGQEDIYFFDVGSYFGQYSLVIKKIFPQVRTCAFEANPYNYIQLQANILLNDFIDDIKSYNRCVTNVSGRTSVSKPDRKNRGAAKIGSTLIVVVMNLIFIVDNLVIDQEFASISDSIIFMKMDIEGAEPLALAGMRELTRRNKMVLQIEDWDFPGR